MSESLCQNAQGKIIFILQVGLLNKYANFFLEHRRMGRSQADKIIGRKLFSID